MTIQLQNLYSETIYVQDMSFAAKGFTMKLFLRIFLKLNSVIYKNFPIRNFLHYAECKHGLIYQLQHTSTICSSPEVTADTMKGGVSFSVHTTISNTVTIIIITTTLISSCSITLVESSTGTVTSYTNTLTQF